MKPYTSTTTEDWTNEQYFARLQEAQRYEEAIDELHNIIDEVEKKIFKMDEIKNVLKGNEKFYYALTNMAQSLDNFLTYSSFLPYKY